MKNNLWKILIIVVVSALFSIFENNITTNKVNAASSGEGTITNPYIIDEESDFSLMNNSSAYFKLSKSITISDETTSLGIESFSGVFEGCGYSIINLKGQFVKKLTGEINNVVIDSPRMFIADQNVSEYLYIDVNDTKYGYQYKEENSNKEIGNLSTKPQNFGFVCGEVLSGGKINSCRVTNATIDTNSHTGSVLYESGSKVTSKMGFIAGSLSGEAEILNCTVEYSKWIYSNTYAVGGIVGYAYFGTISGCLVNNLTITGKNNVALSDIPKAFNGLIVGDLYEAELRRSIVTDINQGTTPHLSAIGCLRLNSVNPTYIYVNNIYYDETVAPFSTNLYEDSSYETVYEGTTILNSQNASVDSYGNVWDRDGSIVFDRHILISSINEYKSSDDTSFIIKEFNQINKLGDKILQRSEVNYLPSRYVAEGDRKIKINVTIDEITYGDKLLDKFNISLDEENTNFDTTIVLKYKPIGWSSYVTVDEDTFINYLSFDWKILYLDNGLWKEDPNSFGTVEVKPYDITNADIRYSELMKYSGNEKKITVGAYIKGTNNSLSFDISGTTTATEIGTYSFTLTGKDNSTGTITKTWKITSGDLNNIYTLNTTTTYDGKSHMFTVNGAPQDATILYSLDGVTYKNDLNLINAGEYKVYYKISHPDFNEYLGEDTLIIYQRTVKVTWLSKELVYTGEAQVPPYELGNVIEGDIVTATVSGAKTDVFVGTAEGYYAQIKSLSNPNYRLSGGTSVMYKIVPKLIKIPYTENSLLGSVEYDGNVHKADISDSTYYYVSGNDGWIDAGVYEFKIVLRNDRNYGWENNFSYDIRYKFEITKATNEWIEEPKLEGWKYGENPNTLTYKTLYDSKMSILYNLVGSTGQSTGVPTKAGDYEVTVKTSSNNFTNVLSKTITFTISQADVSFEFPMYGLTATYGQTLSQVKIDIPSSVAGKWSFVEDSTTLVGDAGNRRIQIMFVPNDANYKTYTYWINMDIFQAEIIYTAPREISELIYKGESMELIIPGSAVDLVMEYKVGDGEWSTEIPTATNAGSYKISYRVDGGKNYRSIENYIMVNIQAKSVSITDITLADVHLSDNGYNFTIASISANDENFDIADINVDSGSFDGDNIPGRKYVILNLSSLNPNYKLENSIYGAYTNINDHEANLDDGDCSTVVTCKDCSYVFVPAIVHDYSGDYLKDESGHYHECLNEGCMVTDDKIGHTATNDNDCTTALICDVCNYEIESAKENHDTNLDDGDCSTEVTCKHCSYVFVPANEHDFSGQYIKDESGHYHECLNDNCTANDSKVSHEYGDWIVIKEATEEEVGIKTKTCVCGHEVSEEIETLSKGCKGSFLPTIFGILAILGGLFATYYFVLRKKFE